VFDIVRHLMPYVVSGRFVYSIFGLTRIPPNFKIKIMYNSVIMTTTDWAQFILSLLSIGAIVVSSIRWYIKVQVKPIAEAVEDKRKATSDKLDHMYDILLEYVSKNSK
jgi:di/tricarboxylate transporter